MAKPYFIIVFIIASCIYTAQQLEIALPALINNYVNDFLCLPIVLSICCYLIRIVKRDTYFKLSLFTILSVTTYYSVYFEYYLPKVNPRYTADIIDVLLYFSGALVYYIMQDSRQKTKLR